MTTSRRTLLTALSTGILTTATGCNRILTSESTTRTTDTEETDTPIYPTTAVPETTTSGTTSQNTTATQSNTAQPPTTTQVVQGPTAEEVYQNVLENNSTTVGVNDDQSFPGQVREAAVEGATQGQVHFNRNGEYIGGDSSLTAMTGTTDLDQFNYEEGDIAAPHLAYSGGQAPALIIEYTNPENGERISDLLIPFGHETDQDDLHENWTVARADNDFRFWDTGPADSHILDADGFENSVEKAGGTDQISEAGQQNLKDMFSSLAYNSHSIDTGITVYSWEAWEKSEELVDNSHTKKVLDEFTELANDPRIDNFAFGYDEQKDSFTAEETMSDTEYREMNPLQYLEWPRE